MKVVNFSEMETISYFNDKNHPEVMCLLYVQIILFIVMAIDFPELELSSELREEKLKSQMHAQKLNFSNIIKQQKEAHSTELEAQRQMFDDKLLKATRAMEENIKHSFKLSTINWKKRSQQFPNQLPEDQQEAAKNLFQLLHQKCWPGWIYLWRPRDARERQNTNWSWDPLRSFQTNLLQEKIQVSWRRRVRKMDFGHDWRLQHQVNMDGGMGVLMIWRMS